MKRFFASAVFLLSSVWAFAALPNGIYLVADSASEQFFGNRKTVEVNDAYGKIVRVKDLPGPAFGDSDLSLVAYDYFPFTKNGKMVVPYAFQFSCRERGHIRRDELLSKNAPFSFVFIFGGASVASGPLFQDESGTALALQAFCSFSTIKPAFSAWNNHLRALDTETVDSTFCGERITRFLSGTMARQELYWNGELLHLREWHPGGELKHSIHYLTRDRPHYYYEREYDANGNLISDVLSIRGLPHRYRYARWYAPGGTLLYVDSSWTSGGTYYSIERGYDSTGVLSYRLEKKYLDPLPHEISGGTETNWPQLIDEWAYENGKLVSSGQSYSVCDICETYEAGTWSYYKNGKVVRTETFEDWRVRDARMRQEALAALQKRQKKKKK